MSEIKVDWNNLIPLTENDLNYEPDQQEIAEYAEYIGLNIPQDKEYLYLAVEALKAPLPPFWQACQTKKGELLFRNKKTRQITPDNPLDSLYRQKVVQLKMKARGGYGVETIKEQSAMFESSGMFRSDKHSAIRQTGKQNQAGQDQLMRHHITQESVYSQSSAGRVEDGSHLIEQKKSVDKWTLKHHQKLREIQKRIMSMVPSSQQLVTHYAQGLLPVSSQGLTIDLKLSQKLNRLNTEFQQKKRTLESLRQEKITLQQTFRSIKNRQSSN